MGVTSIDFTKPGIDKAFGIDAMEISDWQETALVVQAIVHVS
jgi:hypothetical protein